MDTDPRAGFPTFSTAARAQNRRSPVTQATLDRIARKREMEDGSARSAAIREQHENGHAALETLRAYAAEEAAERGAA